MIEIKNLCKTYNAGTPKEVKAVDNLTFTLPNTGFIAITGKSGCGKTTLLNILGLIDEPTSGDMIIDGVSIVSSNSMERTMLRSEKIGFVFQSYNLLESLTVYENLVIGLETAGEIVKPDELKDILKTVDLPNDDIFLNRKGHELSGGQKQRLSIARALLKKTSVLLCDEPTGALDEENSVNIFTSLKKLSQKVLVICVTHEKDYANDYADRIIEMRNGKIFTDTVKQERNQEAVKITHPKHSGLDLKISTHIALGAMLKTKAKLLLSMLTVLLTMFMMTLVVNINIKDTDAIELTTMHDNKCSVFCIAGNMSSNSKHLDYSIAPYQIKAINEYTNGMAAKAERIRLAPFFDENFTKTNDMDYYVQIADSYAVEITEEHLDYLNLTVDERVADLPQCHIPTKPNEIAFTDFMADYIVEYQLNGVKTITDLFDADFNGSKVTAIYKTEIDKTFFYTVNTKFGEHYYRTYMDGVNPLFYVFVAKNSLDDGDSHVLPTAFVIKYSGSYSEAKKFLYSLEYEENTKLPFSYTLRTPYSGFIKTLDSMSNTLLRIGRIVIPLLTALSVIAMLNFILGNMNEVKHELALLKLMGCHNIQIGKIIFIQTLIPLFVNSVLTVIALLVFNTIMNLQIGLSLLVFNSVVFPLLLGMILFFGIVVSAGALKSFNRKSIIGLLN